MFSLLVILVIAAIPVALTFRALHQAQIAPILYKAVKVENVTEVRTLLAQGADPDTRQDTALKRANAQKQGFSAFLDALLHIRSKRAVDPNDRSETVLMLATNADQPDIVKLLLDAGANPNLQNGSGYSALIGATGGGHEEIVKLLVDKGANVNLALKDGWTPLMGSVYGHKEAIVRLLLDKGADINARAKNPSRNGGTALIGAVEADDNDIVQILLEHGADPNVQTAGGYLEPGTTALMLAAQGNEARDGDADMVRMLLEHHADGTLRTKSGQTALSGVKDKEILQLLKQAGAK